jgi:hypothetical protein
MPISLFFHLNLSLAGCGGFFRILARVPEGYEDEAGFHFGVKPVVWRTALARITGRNGA